MTLLVCSIMVAIWQWEEMVLLNHYPATQQVF